MLGAPQSPGKRLDGATLVEVPAAGRVVIYRQSPSNPLFWANQGAFPKPDADGAYGSENGRFGMAVAAGRHGSRILVAEPGTGTVRLLEEDEGGQNHWGQVAHLSSPSADDGFGAALALSGNQAFAGAPTAAADGDNAVGAVHVFEQNAGGTDSWARIDTLLPDDPQPGDAFGAMLAMTGNTLAAGLPGRDGARGAVQFVRPVIRQWREARQLEPAPLLGDDLFGWDVAIDGDTMAVGAPLGTKLGTGFPNPVPVSDEGVVFLFGRNRDGADNWGMIEVLAGDESHTQNSEEFGRSVALEGDTLLVGAPGDVGHCPGRDLRLRATPRRC